MLQDHHAKRNSMVSQVHIIGASGRSGSALCRSLLAGGGTFVPVVRDAAKWAATGIEVPARIADLTDPPRLRNALADATRIVSCAHARHAASVLAAAPARRAVHLPRQHAQVHALARCTRQRRAGRRGGVPRLRPFRCHAAPHDDLRRSGRGQRAATRRSAAPAAVCAVARRRRGVGAADPPGRRDAGDLRCAATRVEWTACAGDRRADPPALRRLHTRCRCRQRTARAANRRAARRSPDGAGPHSSVTFRSCRGSVPPRSAG